MARSWIQFITEMEPRSARDERMLKLFKDDDAANKQLRELREEKEEFENGLLRTVKQLLKDKPLGGS